MLCLRLNMTFILLWFIQILAIPESTMADSETAHLSKPNREQGIERILGLGVVLPYPYFQKPKYRYPVYDKSGRGYLLYGYGGPETYNYKEFNSVDGHH